METKPHAKTNTTDTQNENLMCWRTAIGPQCLRVETINEIHLFPYGYFQHAKFCQQDNKDIVEIQFHGQTIVAKGKHLEPLCDALARLAVERIKLRPTKYTAIARTDGIIETIELLRDSLETPARKSN
jgi:hypothetical protein